MVWSFLNTFFKFKLFRPTRRELKLAKIVVAVSVTPKNGNGQEDRMYRAEAFVKFDKSE